MKPDARALTWLFAIATLLVALVQFGVLATVEAKAGAVAFAAVIVITMFAAEAFDPRLMWDAVEGRNG